jgi:hypothetical protein
MHCPNSRGKDFRMDDITPSKYHWGVFGLTLLLSIVLATVGFFSVHVWSEWLIESCHLAESVHRNFWGGFVETLAWVFGLLAVICCILAGRGRASHRNRRLTMAAALVSGFLAGTAVLLGECIYLAGFHF